MNNGLKDSNDIGKIKTWNDKTKTDFWKNSADELKGSDGSFYAPFLTREQRRYAFNPDICRSYPVSYLRDGEVNGVKTYDFHLPNDVFSMKTLQNEGYCTDDCLGNGVLNISKCSQGLFNL